MLVSEKSSDKRKELRIKTIRAKIEFGNLQKKQQYNVVNISRNALFISNASGFEPELIDKLSEGEFKFLLIDIASGSKMDLLGRVVRWDKNGDMTCGIAIVFWPAIK